MSLPANLPKLCDLIALAKEDEKKASNMYDLMEDCLPDSDEPNGGKPEVLLGKMILFEMSQQEQAHKAKIDQLERIFCQ
jgi:hypothetical protein